MEKRISFFEFQSVKAVAKAIEPYAAKKEALIPRIEKLTEELQKKQEALDTAKAEYEKAVAAINAYEAGIVNIIGFHANELVQKVIETTVSTDGKTTRTTKYLPTSIVTYDDVAKQYIINPDKPVEAPKQEETKPETKLPPVFTPPTSAAPIVEAPDNIEVTDDELPFNSPSNDDPLF